MGNVFLCLNLFKMLVVLVYLGSFIVVYLKFKGAPVFFEQLIENWQTAPIQEIKELPILDDSSLKQRSYDLSIPEC